MAKREFSQVDYFLKLDNIPGESKDAKHQGEIDILSWSFGATQAQAAYSSDLSSPSAGSLTDITVSKDTDKASSQLFLYCANGQYIPTLVITSRKAGGSQQEYLVITCKDILVTSWHVSGSDEDGVPAESVTFSFRKIELSYREQLGDGTLAGAMKAIWDLTKPSI